MSTDPDPTSEPIHPTVEPSTHTQVTPTVGSDGTFLQDAQLPGVAIQLDDFVLLRELGRGSFAQVYLAHQVSLDRLVALKSSREPTKGEGQTLAGLEHDHIVKVYSEFHDATGTRHWLVLQYVPGTHLGLVLKQLFRDGQSPRQGKAILNAVDELAKDDVGFDPIALRDRELFAQGDYVTTVCRLGARLSEALAFAHARGILHCDVKPANILLTHYGRPLLVDFNVAVPTRGKESSATSLGGTILYMAPEHLAAFCGELGADPAKVDGRADLYSLSLVLLEAICGRLPEMAVDPDTVVLFGAHLRRKRLAPEEWLAAERSQMPELIWRVLRRCLDPDPDKRYANGVEFAQALRNGADLLEARQHMPPEGRLARWVRRRPMTALAVLTLLPHLIGTFVNIAYNKAQIPLDFEQQDIFGKIVLGYNAIVYPLCLFLAVGLLRPLYAGLCRLDRREFVSNAVLDDLRQRTLSAGQWGILLALLGWLPGGVVFPLALDAVAGHIGWNVYGHFFLSFTLSGIIALIYSYFSIQFVMLRGIFPRLIHPDQSSDSLRVEVQRIVRGLGTLQVLAALVPLTGAIVLVVLAPADFSLVFRLLVTVLIGMGMFGLGVAVFVTQHLRVLAARLVSSTV